MKFSSKKIYVYQRHFPFRFILFQRFTTFPQGTTKNRNALIFSVVIFIILWKYLNNKKNNVHIEIFTLRFRWESRENTPAQYPASSRYGLNSKACIWRNHCYFSKTVKTIFTGKNKRNNSYNPKYVSAINKAKRVDKP